MAKLNSFDDYMTKLTQMWMILQNYTVELGVVSNDSKRKSVKIDVSKEGLTNAELMFIHENGSPLRNIPARPVLSMTIENAVKKIMPYYLKQIEKSIIDDTATQQSIETYLGQMCMDIQSYAQQLIANNDGRLAPNAPSTIKSKGYNHPLFKTGQLERSITCHLIKK